MHNGLIEDGGGLHVDILKFPHQGAAANMDASFAKRITADHYVICGNGRHDNPERSMARPKRFELLTPRFVVSFWL